MSALLYRLFYLLGMTPWERLLEFPAADQLVTLIDRVEGDQQPQYGRALDLGCGTGNWSLRLASRGWEVTGIEIIPKALKIARKRAAEAGLTIRFLDGDIAELEPTRVGGDFRLVMDIGTVHGIKAEQRTTMGETVTELTGPGASLLMYAFEPSRRGPLPGGMSRAEIEATYPGWDVVDDLAFDLTGMPDSVRKDNPRWYRLVRR